MKSIKSEQERDKNKLVENDNRIKYLESKNKQLETLRETELTDEQLIEKLHTEDNNLSVLLKEEKAETLVVISKVMGEAEAMMEEAKTVMKDAKQK